MYRLLADLTLAVHLGFILFVVLGGVLVVRWRWMAWLHLPAAAWGAAISFMGWICPLTPLENELRRLGGEASYAESFIERYLVPLIYPSGLDRQHFIAIGIAVVAINVAVYGWIVLRSRQARR